MSSTSSLSERSLAFAYDAVQNARTEEEEEEERMTGGYLSDISRAVLGDVTAVAEGLDDAVSNRLFYACRDMERRAGGMTTYTGTATDTIVDASRPERRRNHQGMVETRMNER